LDKTMLPSGSHARARHRTHRFVRQVHLWIGAWGALAAVLYGATGLFMNHRFGEHAWPQGGSAEATRIELQVPVTARADAETLSLWLRNAQALDAQVIRKGAPGDAAARKPDKWTLSGGTARSSWSLEYMPGDATAQLRKTRHDTFAGIMRLHKNVGGGIGWRLLADSFAIGMLLLGISGLWMWARGRTLKQMVFSVGGTIVVLLAVVLFPALS
jgi:hypothetical protein